jgi:polyisoprenoid-binding protein YceI
METMTLQRTETSVASGTMWKIDPTRSKISFSVKHMLFAAVHGRFDGLRGTIRFDRDHPGDAEVVVEIDAATIDTGIKKRDEHLRSADFFDVPVYPTISFRSTRVQAVTPHGDDHWLVGGDLTIRGVTHAAELAVALTGRPDRWDAEVVEFAATATINRKDYGVGTNEPLDGSGLVIGEDVKIAIDVQATKIPS